MIECGLCECKRISAGILLFVYICIAVADLIIILGQFNPPHSISVGKLRGIFALSVFRREVFVRFIDIVGIADHRCLTFIFRTMFAIPEVIDVYRRRSSIKVILTRGEQVYKQ